MIALIDGDVIIYRAGWASEGEDEVIACVRANKTLEDILLSTGATEYQVWLSDSLENNFRFKIDPQYKISRQLAPKPRWYWSIKEFLKNEWDAKVTAGQEADDALGIGQTTTWIKRETERSAVDTAIDYTGLSSVICSIDKDLRQVPGLHYNFVTKESEEISELDGLIHFYSQFLIGDRVDDIDGVRGLGKVKTKALLGSCTTEQELFDKVRYQYKNDERLLKNGKLLWVRREENQEWRFPNVETNIQDPEGECGDSMDGHSVGGETSGGGILVGGPVDSL